MTPKTLEQMAEEHFKQAVPYITDESRKLLIEGNRSTTYAAYLAGAKAALSLPAVEQMRVALVDLMRELNATRDGEGFEIIHWPDTTYGIALAAFDRLSAEVGE